MLLVLLGDSGGCTKASVNSEPLAPMTQLLKRLTRGFAIKW
ncbi:hypothetical protein [Actinacidiphila glaucinigra]|uniref:Uncharacterized protein n=1 Tax=Actinacidiphila glaucinigra TaxID=235986 RepID=A0A238ZKA7_9ACTN|nr:hypothetical protein [Actinacidiphila glaucinigra]SNR83612.1 hypothetical protein SAMN05216252_101340 [Actinacidiphila glaucinigra]